MFQELKKGLAENERGWRRNAEIERDIATAERVGQPMTPAAAAWADMKVELKVIVAQALFLLMTAVAYIVFGALLVFAFPYVWGWFWSFP